MGNSTEKQTPYHSGTKPLLMWGTPTPGKPHSSQVQEDIGNAHSISIFLVLKCFLALDWPAGSWDTTFPMVPPELGLLPLAPAVSSLRLTRRPVVGEVTNRHTETEDEERVGHLAPRKQEAPLAMVVVPCPGHQAGDLPAPAGVGAVLQRHPQDLLACMSPLLERTREGDIRPNKDAAATTSLHCFKHDGSSSACEATVKDAK